MYDEPGRFRQTSERTDDFSYTARLQRLESARWKRRLDVQAPYRWNVRRLCPGLVLDIGCGLGRNLAHLGARAVGVDHNAHSVAHARRSGLTAFTPEQFWAAHRAAARQFDTLLAAHVLEHLSAVEGERVLRGYLPALRPGGRLVLITPQERGWHSDPTHVRWVGPAELTSVSAALGLVPVSQRSFPLPRAAGHVFRYNEFVHVSTSPTAAS